MMKKVKLFLALIACSVFFACGGEGWPSGSGRGGGESDPTPSPVASDPVTGTSQQAVTTADGAICLAGNVTACLDVQTVASGQTLRLNSQGAAKTWRIFPVNQQLIAWQSGITIRPASNLNLCMQYVSDGQPVGIIDCGMGSNYSPGVIFNNAFPQMTVLHSNLTTSCVQAIFPQPGQVPTFGSCQANNIAPNPNYNWHATGFLTAYHVISHTGVNGWLTYSSSLGVQSPIFVAQGGKTPLQSKYSGSTLVQAQQFVEEPYSNGWKQIQVAVQRGTFMIEAGGNLSFSTSDPSCGATSGGAFLSQMNFLSSQTWGPLMTNQCTGTDVETSPTGSIGLILAAPGGVNQQFDVQVLYCDSGVSSC